MLEMSLSLSNVGNYVHTYRNKCCISVHFLPTWNTAISPSKSSNEGLWVWSSSSSGALGGLRKSQSETPITPCRFGSGGITADRLRVELKEKMNMEIYTSHMLVYHKRRQAKPDFTPILTTWGHITFVHPNIHTFHSTWFRLAFQLTIIMLHGWKWLLRPYQGVY